MSFYNPAGLPVLGTLSRDDFVVVGDASGVGRATIGALGQMGLGFSVTNAAANGTTDDAAAINAAMVTASNAGGGTVYLDPGKTYRINSRLDCLSNVKVVGDGTTILHADQSFRAASVTNGGFEGITFQGLGAGSSGLVQACTGFQVIGCKFEDQPSFAISITSTSTKCRVAFCEFNDGLSTALTLTGTGVTGNEILFNSFNNNVGFGIWLTGGAYQNLVEGNRTYLNGLELVGITYDSYRNRIIGNHAEGTGDNGISVTGPYNVLAGNVTKGNAFHGLCLYGSRNVVSGHHSMNNGTAGAGYAGIAFTTAFGGCAQLNSITGAYLDDDQGTATQAHCLKFNSGAYSAWGSGQTISAAGTYRVNANKLYRSTNTGTTGVTAPTHTSGTVSDGAVSWLYLDTFFSSSNEPGGNELSAIVMQRFLTSQFLDNTTQKTNKIDGYYRHSATPESVITAPIGSLAINTAGGTSTTLYVKTSGTGNTGWTAK